MNLSNDAGHWRRNAAIRQTGAINKITYWHDKLEEKRRAFKHWNRTAYKLTKYTLITLLLLWFIF